MSNSVIRTIKPNDETLNDLFKETLDGIRDDLGEAQENVDKWAKLMDIDQQATDLYGPLYNSALTIKGSARDRQLKFLNMFKERVTRKETVKIAEDIRNKESGQGAGFSHTDLNTMLEQMKNRGEFKSINLDDE